MRTHQGLGDADRVGQLDEHALGEAGSDERLGCERQRAQQSGDTPIQRPA